MFSSWSCSSHRLRAPPGPAAQPCPSSTSSLPVMTATFASKSRTSWRRTTEPCWPWVRPVASAARTTHGRCAGVSVMCTSAACVRLFDNGHFGSTDMYQCVAYTHTPTHLALHVGRPCRAPAWHCRTVSMVLLSSIPGTLASDPRCAVLGTRTS